MAQFSRLEVAQAMKETGMIPLFFNNDIELSKKVLKACYDGGARLMEFTARGDFAHEVFDFDSIHSMSQTFRASSLLSQGLLTSTNLYSSCDTSQLRLSIHHELEVCELTDHSNKSCQRGSSRELLDRWRHPVIVSWVSIRFDGINFTDFGLQNRHVFN